MSEDMQSIIEFFRDKRVLIVGNSVEMMTQNNAELIDSYDVVVRLGRGVKTTPEDEKAVGAKVDVWVTGYFRLKLLEEQNIRAKLQDKLVLLNGSRIDVTDGWTQRIIRDYPYQHMFSESEILEYYEKYGIINNSKKSFRLSAGMWTILFMVDRVKCYKSLDIIGFDFFKVSVDLPVPEGSVVPTSWHVPSVGAGEPVHNGEFEEKLVTEMVEAGKLNWIHLSDNKKKHFTRVKHGVLAKRTGKQKKMPKEDYERLRAIDVINLDITQTCNLACTFCPQSSPNYVNKHDVMTLETVEQYLKRVRELYAITKKRVVTSLSGTGEGTTHKDFAAIVKLIAENRHYTNLQLITNGAKLYKHRELIPLFNRIRYNIYSDDKNKTKDLLLKEVAKHGHVELVYIDNTVQYTEVKDFSDRAGLLGGEVKKPKYNYCRKLFRKMMINADGSYLLCCDDWNRNIFGSIYEQSFESYLLSDTLRKARQDVLDGTRTMAPCNTCSYSSPPRRT